MVSGSTIGRCRSSRRCTPNGPGVASLSRTWSRITLVGYRKLSLGSGFATRPGAIRERASLAQPREDLSKLNLESRLSVERTGASISRTCAWPSSDQTDAGGARIVFASSGAAIAKATKRIPGRGWCWPPRRRPANARATARGCPARRGNSGWRQSSVTVTHFSQPECVSDEQCRAARRSQRACGVLPRRRARSPPSPAFSVRLSAFRSTRSCCRCGRLC